MAPGVLLHVGYIKAGSSWLQAWFSRHPQIAFHVGSLSGYAGVFDLIGAASGGGALPRQFVVSEERLTGGLSVPDGYFRLLLRHKSPHLQPPPIKIGQARTCEWLRALYPDARILIVTRGFAGAVQSVYSEVVRLGSDLGFREFLDLYQPYIADWLDYDHVLRLYRETFGADRVLVVPFEILRSGEDAFAALFERELGVEPLGVRMGRVHPSLTPTQIHWYAALSRQVVGRIARHLRDRRAMQLYMLYAHRVIDRPWANLLVRTAAALSVKEATFEIPNGYLEMFRGKATELIDSPLHAPYRADYLLPDVSA